MTAGKVRVEDLIGLPVTARNGKRIGHIEEIRATRHDDEITVDAFLLGAGALRTRFAMVRRIVSRERTIVVRWDQIDLSNPEKPTLTCAVSELAVET